MKTKLLFILAFLAIFAEVQAQSPYAFNYQSVIRDADGNILKNENVGLQLSILKGSITGAVTYQESHSLISNDYGLINLQVGTGNVGFGLFDTLSWGEGPYFMQVGIDFSGGTNYQTMGTTQLVSVPYALHARTADSIVGGTVNFTEVDPVYGASVAANITSLDTANWNNHTVDTDTHIDSIGIINHGFVAGPHTVDTDTHIDSAGIAGHGFHAGAHTVDTDTHIDSAGIASIGFVAGAHTIDTDTQLDEAAVDAFVANNGYLLNEVDGSITNELQALSISNDTVFLTDGGFVKLPVAVVGFNGQYSNLIGAPTTVSSFTNDAGYLTTFTEVDGSITNEIQDLQLINNILTITNNGSATSIDLSGYLDDTDTQLTEAQVDAYVANNGYLTSFTEVDGSVTNELQTISKSGSTVSLSNNGGSFTDSDTQLDEAAVDAFVANNGYLTSETDGSVTNEIQSLSLSNDTISLSNGGGEVKLPASATAWTVVGSNISRDGGSVLIGPSTTSWSVDKFQVSTENNTHYYWSSANFKTSGTTGGENRGILVQSIGTNSGTNVGMRVSAKNAATNYSVLATDGDLMVHDRIRAGGYTAPTEAQINAIGDSMAIYGYTDASSSNNWQNVGVKGVTNTANNPGRGVYGIVHGANYGMAVRGEAATDQENQGLSGYALSKPGNTNNQYGVYGEARKDWPESNSGTGNHYGGYFIATGEGTYNMGASGYANTPGTGSNRGLEGSANSSTASHNIGTAGFASGTSSSTNYGMYGQAQNGTGINYGIQGYSAGSGTNQTGIYGYSGGASGNNYGVDGTTEGTGAVNVGTGGFAYGVNSGTNKNYGLFGYAQNADTNYGVYSTVTGSDNVNYGMYSEVSGGSSNNYALYAKNEATNGGHGIYSISSGVGSNSNYGIRGVANGSSTENTGVYAYASGSATTGIGLNAQAFSFGTNSYGLFAYATGATTNYAGYFAGNVTITGNLNVTGSISKGSGTFKIDHPLDPENKYLVHSFVESPEMMNVYSGNINTDANGYATVNLPDYFEAANKDFRYQLTVIGSFAQAIIKEKISGNKFVVQTNNPNVEVSWQVTAVRADKYAEANRIQPEVEKTEKGTYLHPEVYGLSSDKSENAEAKELIHNPENDAIHATNGNSSKTKKFVEEKRKSKKITPSPIEKKENESGSKREIKEIKKQESPNEEEPKVIYQKNN
ncbi:MAG: beta strand repeat-containing protein [Salibacteraceae bacterium]